jgi:hypothetical protein
MKRSMLMLGTLISLLILTRTPGSREPVARLLPGRTVWQRAEQILVGLAPPDPEVYADMVRELEIVCGDPAGSLFIDRTLRRWPDFEPARRARAMQSIRHGQAPLDSLGASAPMHSSARRSACE